MRKRKEEEEGRRRRRLNNRSIGRCRAETVMASNRYDDRASKCFLLFHLLLPLLELRVLLFLLLPGYLQIWVENVVR